MVASALYTRAHTHHDNGYEKSSVVIMQFVLDETEDESLHVCGCVWVANESFV
jgi:hypothetical protein